jgi:hypothetical protein
MVFVEDMGKLHSLKMLRHLATYRLVVTFVGFCVLPLPCGFNAAARAAGSLPSPGEVYSSPRDLWGEAAVQQPGGPTYEFFRDLLPPLRYVDARFRCYPIVLSAPSNPTKARLVSDGSSVNVRERSLTWSHEQGTPCLFFMGDKREPFGQDLAKLQGPTFADGYLPIVRMSYSTQGSVWEQESFCSTDPALADYGAVFVKFTLKSANPVRFTMPKVRAERQDEAVKGVENAENVRLISQPYDDRLEAWFEGPALYKLDKGRVMAPAVSQEDQFAAMKEGKAATKGTAQVLAMSYPGWITNPGRGAIIAPVKAGESVYVTVFTRKIDPAKLTIKLTPEEYEKQRDQCGKTWNDLLHAGINIETPESVVNNAWRASVIGNYMLITGDALHYSACNQYDGIYIGEGGDAIFGLGLYGHHADAQRLMPAQFKSRRAGLEFHRAAFKLQMLAKCYRLHPDPEYVKALEPMWQREIDIILKGREPGSGMLPREKYCGDVATLVYSLNSNANCWRALRDMSVLCSETGRTEQAQQLAQVADEYRKVILAALDKTIDRSVNPPFVPVALSGEEDPHQPIWATTMGSYWNLMIHYILAAGVFTPESETANDVLRYVEQNGGLCMGMLRARATPGNFWVQGPRANDLYGLRRNLVLLQRDEVDLALVTFYGKLAQGMARDTFIGCEGSSLVPLDQFGRQMALPPNSSANTNYLQTLRYLLVQDPDLDDDDKPETLRLAFATPKAWLKDGGEVKVERAPTAFGDISFTIHSDVDKGKVTADVSLPERAPAKTLLRLRVPDGYEVKTASAGSTNLMVQTTPNGATLDLTKLTGKVHIVANVARASGK